MALGEPAFAQGTLSGETLTCGSVATTRACDPANPDKGSQPTITELFGFEDQGDCVSFIAIGGKNEPGQNNGPG